MLPRKTLSPRVKRGITLPRLYCPIRNGKLAPPAKDSSGDYVWLDEDMERLFQVLDGARRSPISICGGTASGRRCSMRRCGRSKRTGAAVEQAGPAAAALRRQPELRPADPYRVYSKSSNSRHRRGIAGFAVHPVRVRGREGTLRPAATQHGRILCPDPASSLADPDRHFVGAMLVIASSEA
jgi:hypothetical protein